MLITMNNYYLVKTINFTGIMITGCSIISHEIFHLSGWPSGLQPYLVTCNPGVSVLVHVCGRGFDFKYILDFKYIQILGLYTRLLNTCTVMAILSAHIYTILTYVKTDVQIK